MRKRAPRSHGSSGGDNVTWIDKKREKIVFFSFSNERRSPCCWPAASAAEPPPHSGLQINLLMDDTLRPLAKVAPPPPSIPPIVGTQQLVPEESLG